MIEKSDKNGRVAGHTLTAEHSVSQELGVHGPRWAGIFDGYFSDAAIARPLLNAVEESINIIRPDVVADLGGGTGFLLANLLRCGPRPVRLVNVDLSEKQLAACTDRRIVKLQTSIENVERRQLLAGEGRLLLMARSMLHYFSSAGLDPLLKHLRGQMKPGEYFVHQSACFACQKDADLMNLLYERMDTGKRFFTNDELAARLENAGFATRAVAIAPPLLMSSTDLGERYGLGPEQTEAIGREIEELFGCEQEVFAREGREFRATLCYCVFTCKAV